MRIIKLLKNHWQYILLFILFLGLTWFFPITGNDWFWANLKSINDFDMFWNLSQGNFIGTGFVLLITKYKFLRIITYSVITTCSFIIMKNLVNKKNKTLIYIGIFLFFLLNKEFINSGYVWTSGFVNNFISTTFVLLIIHFNFKDKLIKTHKLIIFFLGLIAALINPIISMFLLIITIIYLLYYKKNNIAFKQTLVLLIGLGVGSIEQAYWSINAEVPLLSLDFANNILHKIIPMFFETNFILTLITISFLLFLSIKIFIRGDVKRKINTVIAICSITIYALSVLLCKNDIINYITYILFTFGSLFLLLNANNSIGFKKRIKAYYMFKITYIFLLTFSTNINYGSLIFPLILDIIVILELINYIFPNNFLDKIWFLIVALILVAEIYIYSIVYSKNEAMNVYIKNHLECSMYDFTIPSKYETDYLYGYLPQNSSELINYITYYDINLPHYGKINFSFNQSHND